MTLNQLRYAITIADTGSYNRAAEQLYIAQPSLTNSIKELETELDITIFYRNGRGSVLTEEGKEFISRARQIVASSDSLKDYFGNSENSKRKFSVSTQHYTFATKAFVEMAKQFDMNQYEFAVRETDTMDVIESVASQTSEIGLLYLCDFNRAILTRIFRQNSLDFHQLINCNAYVYIWRGHPLAGKKAITFDDLKPYPCLMFEQASQNAAYFQEEILAYNEYPQVVKATDRGTMLNLMLGLNGYTLCSGIICEELNGSDYIAIPYRGDENNPNSTMEIGYITKAGSPLSRIGRVYIDEVKKYLNID